MDKVDYKSLLESYLKLSDENKKLKEEGTNDYSLINALLKKDREVELHSNFIYSMINIGSSHYCGAVFLEIFLESIGLKNFINVDNATVYREKGKIDLLIKDETKVIIIENKLKAVDQKHQISRYIQYAIKNYLTKHEKDDIEENIIVVYLSQYKEKPSKDSFIGFKLNGNELIWGNQEIDFLDEESKLNLPKDTKITFKRVMHSDSLDNWTKKCIDWLQSDEEKNKVAKRANLIYAFKEYGMILERLQPTYRRKIMSLDDYVLKEKDKEKEMYTFMSEAYGKFNSYLGKKLFKEINFLVEIGKESEFNYKEFQKFDEKNCINWFEQKGNSNSYRNVGFQLKFQEDNWFIFGMGKENISFGKCKSPEEYKWKDNIKYNRDSLQKNKEGKAIFDLIKELEGVI